MDKTSRKTFTAVERARRDLDRAIALDYLVDLYYPTLRVTCPTNTKRRAVAICPCKDCHIVRAQAFEELARMIENQNLYSRPDGYQNPGDLPRKIAELDPEHLR